MSEELDDMVLCNFEPEPLKWGDTPSYYEDSLSSYDEDKYYVEPSFIFEKPPAINSEQCPPEPTLIPKKKPLIKKKTLFEDTGINWEKAYKNSSTLSEFNSFKEHVLLSGLNPIKRVGRKNPCLGRLIMNSLRTSIRGKRKRAGSPNIFPLGRTQNGGTITLDELNFLMNRTCYEEFNQ